MKINHIGIEVSDIYKIELFYKKIWNFKTCYRYVSKNTKDLKTVILKKNNIVIELLQRKRSDNFLESKIINNPHISFETNNINKEYIRLLNLGIKDIKKPRITGDGFLEMELKDPEQNLIEIGKRLNEFRKPKIKAIIFDFDGTLVNSEDNYYEADKILFAKYGINFTQDMKLKYIGISTVEMIEEIKNKFRIKENTKDLINQNDKIYHEIALKKTEVFPEMLKLINILKNNNYPMAIASGSSKFILDSLISKLNLSDFFKTIISTEEVDKGKPEPDIFLEAAKRLNIEPENCLVIEDSQYGIEAAKRAFMYCMGIPFLTNNLTDSFLMTDFLFKKGMNSFTAKKAINWIKKYK